MEPMLGQVQAFAFNFAPIGWALCQGQLMAIQQNTALYDLIGTTYGGDGTTTFALPKLSPIQPNGPFYCISILGVMPKRP
jgi:microcystin-dependent protein